MKVPRCFFVTLLCGASLGVAPASAQVLSPRGYAALLLVTGTTVAEADQSYVSILDDTAAVVAVGGGSLTLTNPTVTVKGDSSNEEASAFWGMSAGIVAAGGAHILLTGASVQTSGAGSNGVFATATGSKVTLANTSIATTKDWSRGLSATFGASVEANDVSITTVGAHSAALVAGRGGGTVAVVGGTIKTSGEDSPAIWSSGFVSVSTAVLVSVGSQAAVIEGRNSITVTDTALVGAKACGVLFSPGASTQTEGAGVFTMTGGSLTALEGPLFRAANTSSTVNLSQVSLVQNSGVLVTLEAATFVLNADGQTLTGDVVGEGQSSFTINLRGGSTWEGAADKAQIAKAMNINLDATSHWTVTADSRVNVLTLSGTDAAAASQAISSGGHSVQYKASANPWLGGRTLALADGGVLKPY